MYWVTNNLSKVDRTDNDGLSNPQSSDESSGIHGAQRPVVSHEDGNSNDPENTELSSSPETADSVAY